MQHPQSQQEESLHIYYETDYDIFSIHMTKPHESSNKTYAAISSLTESINNLLEVVELDFEGHKVTPVDKCMITYPASKIMWSPFKNQGQDKQMIAVASDKLRLYDFCPEEGLTLRKELVNTLLKEFSAPLTSFDWSEQNNYICCSSIDTTCTLFDINRETFFKQLITHDKEVVYLPVYTYIIINIKRNIPVKNFYLKQIVIFFIYDNVFKKYIYRIKSNF